MADHTDVTADGISEKIKGYDNVQHLENDEIHHLHLTKTLATTITLRMKIFSIFISFGGWLVNFDLGYTGIVYQMQPFNRAYGTCANVPVAGAPNGTTRYTCGLTATQQSVISIYLLFMALGALAVGFLGTFLGRKTVIRTGCVLTMIGAAGMSGSAGSFAGYLVCKYLSGFGIGLVVATGPTYGAECTPPKRRGLLVSFYTVGLGFGSVVVALVCLGTKNLTNYWAWRIPIVCQIPVALIYMTGLALFPESPRWLMVQGKVEEARKAFAKFYNKDPHSEDINTQIQEIQTTIEAEKAATTGAASIEILQRKYIRRTLTASFCIIGGALSGINFVIPYATIFLAGVGIKNPFEVTVYLNLCVLFGSAVGPIPCQYLGRRRTFMTGYAGMAVCMIIFSATNSGLGNANESAKKVLIAFLCIWAFLFTCFNASTSWLASAEQHSVRHRTYGTAFATAVGFTFNFASNFWTPYMINKKYGNMGTNVGYFYFGLLIIWFFVTYFALPETGNLSLEEIDSLYDSNVKPWHTSLKKNNQKMG